MITIDEARTRVARGAAHLDGLFPLWFEHIDVLTFDLGVSCYCVLGQLHGDFNEAVKDRGIIPRRWYQRVRVARDKATEMGFDCSDEADVLNAYRAYEFKLLQDAWIEAIAARRHPVTAEGTIEYQDEEARKAAR